MRKPGADGGGDPFLEAERGGAALQHVPMVLAEAPDGMMVLNCGALRGPAVEQSLHRGPVEFPPSGELRHENRIGAPTRDDCVIQDCYEADGTLTSFGAETLFQAWPDGKREPSVTLAMVCQEAQIAGDVRALLSDEPQVRVELQLDPELSRELDTLDLYQ